MFNIGPQELLLILLVALIVVGPKRLPELSRSIGKGLRELRKAQDEVRKTINVSLDETEPTAAGRSQPASRGAPTARSSGEPAETEASAGDDDAENIARTLGRGLAEIRRTRQEIQRSFRVDLTDRSSGPRPRPPRAGPRQGPVPPPSTAPAGEPSGAQQPDAGSQAPAEPPTSTEPGPG